MTNDYIEDVAMMDNLQIGPVIQEHFTENYFKVTFNTPHWFQDTTELLVGGTVGENNRRFVHTRLEEAIDNFIRRVTNG